MRVILSFFCLSKIGAGFSSFFSRLEHNLLYLITLLYVKKNSIAFVERSLPLDNTPWKITLSVLSSHFSLKFIALSLLLFNFLSDTEQIISSALVFSDLLLIGSLCHIKVNRSCGRLCRAVKLELKGGSERLHVTEKVIFVSAPRPWWKEWANDAGEQMCSDTCEYAERYKMFKNPHAHQLDYLFSFPLVFLLHTTGFDSWIHKKQTWSQLSSLVLGETLATNRGGGAETFGPGCFILIMSVKWSVAKTEKKNMASD